MRTAASSSVTRSAQRPAAEPAMIVGRLGDLVADGEQRVQRRHGVLQDGGDPTPADRNHLLRALRQQILPFELDAASHDAGARREQAHERVTDRRLAGAGLADETECLARLQGEADGVDRLHHAGAPEAEIVGLQILDAKQGRHVLTP